MFVDSLMRLVQRVKRLFKLETSMTGVEVQPLIHLWVKVKTPLRMHGGKVVMDSASHIKVGISDFDSTISYIVMDSNSKM